MTRTRLFSALRIGIPALVIFAVALVHNLNHIPDVVLHRDETRWVGRAFLFDEFVRDPLGPTWDESLLTQGQPPLGSYMMGLGLTLQGRDTTTTRNRQLYDFNHGFQWNVDRGRVPSEGDINAGRRTNSVVGALLAVTVFLIGARLSGMLGGVAAGLVLIFHPLARQMATWTGSDITLALLIALAALVSMMYVDKPSWRRAILLGVLLGLGGATKLTPLLVAGGVGALGAALMLVGRPWQRESVGAHQIAFGARLLTVPFVAFFAFVATYPYLWADPIGRTITLFTFRAGEMDNQGDIRAVGTPGWDSIAVDGGLPDAISRTWFWLGQVRTTSNYLAAQAQSAWGWSWDLPWLDLVLGAVGLAVLSIAVLLDGIRTRAGMVLTILLGHTAIIWLGMRADFDRYQMPVVVAVAIGAGVAAAMLSWPVRMMIRRLVGRVTGSRRTEHASDGIRDPRRDAHQAVPTASSLRTKL